METGFSGHILNTMNEGKHLKSLHRHFSLTHSLFSFPEHTFLFPFGEEWFQMHDRSTLLKVSLQISDESDAFDIYLFSRHFLSNVPYKYE